MKCLRLNILEPASNTVLSRCKVFPYLVVATLSMNCGVGPAVEGSDGRDLPLALGNKSCVTVGFEIDGDGAPLWAGADLEEAFAPIGLSVSVRSDDPATVVSLPPAQPTFEDEGLTLNASRVLRNGGEAEALTQPVVYVLTVDEPVCVRRLGVVEHDDADTASLEAFDRDGHSIDVYRSTTNEEGERQFRFGPEELCGVASIEVSLEYGGALDDLVYCKAASTLIPLWTRIKDRGGNDAARGVDTDCRRRVTAVGDTIGRDLSTNGFITQLSGRNGRKRWRRILSKGGEEIINDVTIDVDQDPVVVGTVSTKAGPALWLRKLNRRGRTRWTRRPRSSGKDQGLGVTTDRWENVFVTGSTLGKNGKSEIWLRKYTRWGWLRWSRSIPSEVTGDSVGHGVATNRRGDVYVVGEMQRTTKDVFLRKYNRCGVEQWTEFIDFGGDDFGRDVVVDREGFVVLTGFGQGLFGGTDAIVAKFDSEGVEEWIRTADVNLVDRSYGLDVDRHNNVYIAGESDGDGWLRKYNSDGIDEWDEFLDGDAGGDDVFYDVAIDRCQCIIVAGSTDNGTDSDLLVRKYEDD